MATFKDRPVKRQVQKVLFDMIKTKPIPLWLGLAGDAVEEYKKVIPQCERLILVDRTYVSPEVEKIDVYKKFKQLYDEDQIPNGSHIDLDFCGSYETYGKILNLIVLDLRKRGIKATVSYTFSVFHRTANDTFDKALGRLKKHFNPYCKRSIFYNKGTEVGSPNPTTDTSYLTRSLSDIPNVTIIGTRSLVYQDSPQAMFTGILQINVDRYDTSLLNLFKQTRGVGLLKERSDKTLNKYVTALSKLPKVFTTDQIAKLLPNTKVPAFRTYASKVLIPKGYIRRTHKGIFQKVEPPTIPIQEAPKEIPELKVRLEELQSSISNPNALETFNRLLDIFEKLVK